MFLLLAVGGCNVKPVVLDTLDEASFKLGTVDLTQFNSFCGHAVAQVMCFSQHRHGLSSRTGFVMDNMAVEQVFL